MVVNKGISLMLHSPESLNTMVPNALEEFLLNESAPNNYSTNDSIATRYVPILPGSSFWLSYRVLVPPPPGLDIKLYVFKLFVGRVHFATWSVDGESERPEQRWKGRCMFGLFEDPAVIDHTNGGRKVFQKRGFAFAPPTSSNRGDKHSKNHKKQNSRDSDTTGSERNKLRKKRRSEDLAHPFTPPKSWAKRPANEANDERFIEVRVFRAASKKRIPRDIPSFDPIGFATNGSKGLDFKHAGYATRPHPRRYYEFDLIDPKGRPYATFKFYYRTMEELKALGIALNDEGTPKSTKGSPDSEATITPTPTPKREPNIMGSKFSVEQSQEQEFGSISQSDELVKAVQHEATSSPLPPRRDETGDDPDEDGEAFETDAKRLSIPPSIKLLPSLGGWRWNVPTMFDGTLKEGRLSGLRSKSSIENLKRRSGQGLWRAFHEEREAEHGGY